VDLVEDHLTRGFQDRYCGRCVSHSRVRGAVLSQKQPRANTRTNSRRVRQVAFPSTVDNSQYGVTGFDALIMG